MEIRLPMRWAGSAPRCDQSRLTVVDHDLTPDDTDYYDRVGWDTYRPENHRSVLLPTIGPKRTFDREDVVVSLAGRNWAVRFDLGSCDRDIGDPDGKFLVLAETNEPETDQSRARKPYLIMFDQPRWVQNEYCPLDPNGKPCVHFATIENEWGDMGNINVLVGIDDSGLPFVAYYEAACH